MQAKFLPIYDKQLHRRIDCFTPAWKQNSFPFQTKGRFQKTSNNVLSAEIAYALE